MVRENSERWEQSGLYIGFLPPRYFAEQKHVLSAFEHCGDAVEETQVRVVAGEGLREQGNVTRGGQRDLAIRGDDLPDRVQPIPDAGSGSNTNMNMCLLYGCYRKQLLPVFDDFVPHYLPRNL